MSSKVYRLLRNNKEQGPFTSGELIQKGLKPYDLIWVDGRSAAWSYPGELPEFKLLVPVPDEQPFDRFFKKPETSSQVSPSIQAAVAVSDNIIQPVSKQPKPRYKVSAAWSRIQTITAPLYRDVMVTEPARKSSSNVRQVKTETSFQSRPLSWEDAWSDWEKEKSEVHAKPSLAVAQPAIPAQKQTINEIFADAPVLETKYSQPLESLKDKYIDNILQQKKRSGGFSFGKASEFVIPCIALFVIFSIGYWLLHHNNKTASALGSNVPKTEQQPVASAHTNELPANLNNTTDNTAGIITANQDAAHDAVVSNEQPAAPKTEQKKTKDYVQAVKFNTPATKKIVASKNINDTKIGVTPFNNSKVQVTNAVNVKSGNAGDKLFDPSVINNVPRDNSYNDQTAGNTGDLNALDNRPVRRRTNGDQTTNNQQKINDQTLNNLPTVSKRSSGKANIKYVSVPQYVEMNNGSGSVKIENVSDVDLDLVVVDVQYYDASSRFRKGETLYLHNLRAGKSVVVKTPRDVNSMYAISKVSLVSSDSKGVYIIGDN